MMTAYTVWMVNCATRESKNVEVLAVSRDGAMMKAERIYKELFAIDAQENTK